MTTIHGMLKRVESIDIFQLASQTIADSKIEIADKNRAQLMEGYDKNGKKLKKYASTAYAKRKNQRNPFPGFGTPDLYNMGNYQEGITLRILTKQTFEMYSTDWKYALLKKKYPDNLGLSNQSKEEIQNEIVIPSLRQKVKSILRV